MKISKLIGESNKEKADDAMRTNTSQARLSDILSNVRFENEHPDQSGLSERSVISKIAYYSPNLNLKNLQLFLKSFSSIDSDGLDVIKGMIYRLRKINFKKIEYFLGYLKDNSFLENVKKGSNPHSVFHVFCLNSRIQWNSNFMKKMIEFYKENFDQMGLSSTKRFSLLKNFAESKLSKRDALFLYNHANKLSEPFILNKTKCSYTVLTKHMIQNVNINKLLSKKLVFKQSFLKYLDQELHGSAAWRPQELIENSDPKFYYRLYNIYGCEFFCKKMKIKKSSDLHLDKYKKIPKGIRRKIERNFEYKFKKEKYNTF